MKAADYVASFLAEQGVRRVYEMCGGMITHMLDSLGAQGEIDIISMHHEQAAGFAAEAEARMTGVPGVVMATSGPGATNLVTAIGSCYFDSVPTVFITGQVNTFELRGTSGVRQAGFQETDIVAVASPITKAAWQVTAAEDLPRALAEAFRIALEGRPGPVLLDVPMDVQRQDVDSRPSGIVHPQPAGSCAVKAALEALASARRPLILAGGGVRAAGAADALRVFATRAAVPVVLTLMGADAIPFSHAQHVGLIGSYGNRWANLALGEADCILVLGARLDVRQTGADTEYFRAGKTLIRVDIDADQLGWRVGADVTIRADVGVFLDAAIRSADQLSSQNWAEWRQRVGELKRDWPDSAELADKEGINPAILMHRLSAASENASAFVTDVGQNQMWAAQSIRLRDHQRFLTSGGMGAMGFALPAAIGAALARPSSHVVMIAGDGGMQVNIQELETVARLRLPIKMVVINNHCLGMVRQFQDEYLGSRHQSTLWGYGAPDFCAIAGAYGIDSSLLDSGEQIDAALARLFAEPLAPCLLEVTLPQSTLVRPKVSFGNPVFVMDPPQGGEAADE